LGITTNEFTTKLYAMSFLEIDSKRIEINDFPMD
jgi:hypothetical protein